MNSYRTRRDNIFRTKLYTVSCSGYKPFDLFCTSLFTSFIVNSQDLCRLSKLDPLYLIQTRFLEMNGIRLQATNEEIVQIGLSVADGSMSYEDLLAWVKKHRAK